MTGSATEDSRKAPAIALSTAVMTHPSRLAEATAIRQDHRELEAQLVVDPEPEAPPATARTARLAWAAVDPSATHHLVLQDDVRLSTSFLSSVLTALAEQPDRAIGLFTEWCSATAFAGRLHAWFGSHLVEVCDEYIPTLGLVLPAALARAVSVAGDTATADDVLLLAVLRRERIPAYVTVPTLAEHAALPSLTGNDFMGQRRSVCFLGSDPAPGRWPVADQAFGLVPCYSRSYPRPFYLASPARRGERWIPVAPEQVLHARGIPPEGLAAGLAARIAPLAARSLRPDVLAGLWLTAVMHGIEVVVMAGKWGVPVDDALREPLGWRALDTMGPAVLDRFVTPEVLDDAAEPLRDLVRQAFMEGIERGAAVAARRGPAYRVEPPQPS